ncbi:uncharacterized protein LOC106084888 [Stomoxys calcitrans]|uniref:uncharacterized protein LOC106084888 n=1 Tax=Stomoxys calcitrans TaxID=35570 RepID=UPI0027E3669E|nr:uncharacterized protein LOC106084888 [Stomoxys calcitrans]
MSSQDLSKPSPLDEVKFAGGRYDKQFNPTLQFHKIIVEQPEDEVDFSSGFETQYEQEYRPLKPKVIVPDKQNPKTLWYHDLKTILLVALLIVIFLLGTILLTILVFTSDPLYVFAIISVYLILTITGVIVEVKSIHLR